MVIGGHWWTVRRKKSCGGASTLPRQRREVGWLNLCPSKQEFEVQGTTHFNQVHALTPCDYVHHIYVAFKRHGVLLSAFFLAFRTFGSVPLSWEQRTLLSSLDDGLGGKRGRERHLGSAWRMLVVRPLFSSSVPRSHFQVRTSCRANMLLRKAAASTPPNATRYAGLIKSI